MIQRLLRGKVLYIVLMGFVVALFLYGRTTNLQSAFPPELTSPSETAEQPEWWTQDIDPDVLRTAATTDPLLRLMLAALSLFMVGMSIGGLVLLIWGIVTGRIWTLWSHARRRPPPWTLGEFLRILVLMTLVAFLLQFAHTGFVLIWPDLSGDPNLWINVSMLLLDGILILTVFAFASGKGPSLAQAIGLQKKRISYAMRIGVRGYMAIFPWLLLLLLLVVQIANAFGIEPPPQPIHEMIFGEERPGVMALTIILTCLAGPFAEELFFRGVLLAALRRHTSRWGAMVISAALFSVVHTNLIGFVPIFLLGCLLADLYERTGSLVSSIAVHILHNTFLLSLALAYRWAV